MNEAFLTEIKRLVADPAAGPRLNDLLSAEAGRLIAALAGDEFDPAAPPSNEGVIDRLDRYTPLTADLPASLAMCLAELRNEHFKVGSLDGDFVGVALGSPGP
jgi:hypothetical protein